MGRPPRPKQEKRTERLQLMFKVDEMKAIKKLAKESGVTVSTWGRDELIKLLIE